MGVACADRRLRRHRGDLGGGLLLSRPRSERVQRELAQAREGDIRRRLVQLAVGRGIKVMDEGDSTGALPWFAEAMVFDSDDPRGRGDAPAAPRHADRRSVRRSTPCSRTAGPIKWATLDRSGRLVATASADGTARAWDAATGGAATPPLKHDGPVNRAEFRGDGRRLVTASDDGWVRVWDVDGGRAEAGVPALRTGPRLARENRDVQPRRPSRDLRRLRRDDPDLGRDRRVADRRRAPARFAAARPGAEPRRLADRDRRIPRRGHPALAGRRRPAECIHRAQARQSGCAGSPSARTAPGWPRRAWTGRHGSGTLARASRSRPRSSHGQWLAHAEFSPDGSRLATGSEDGTARVWDARTGQPIGTAVALMNHASGVNEVSFSPDGSRLVTAGNDGTARVWDAATGLPLSPPLYHGTSLLRARFTPDGYRVLTVGSDPTRAALGPDRRRCPGGDRRGHRRDELRMLRSERPVDRHGGQRRDGAGLGRPERRGGLAAAAASRRSRPGGVRRRRPAHRDGGPGRAGAGLGRAPAAGRPPARWSMRGRCSTSASAPMARRLATASADGAARIWDAATGRAIVPRLEHGQAVLGLAFSPDGRYLATGEADGTARVWDAETGRPVLTPLGHDAPVACVAFSPDGRALLTACSDDSLAVLHARQWDLTTGHPLGPALRHGDGVLWAAYSPDGRRIATASEDRTARVWDAATGEPLTRAARPTSTRC